MKAIIIYSGKGGVGKTTTTANIARLLAKQGNKVFIIDADINTPSMNTEFEGDHPHEMIWVHSSGNMFSKFIYLEKSMVRQYLELAKKKIHSINPDYVLIDTPPSVTNVHIELLSRVKVSYVLFVTQPTKLSNQDVLRTMDFFHERCGKVNCGIVENMCYGINAPNTEVHLITGEIGICSLLTGQRGHFELPRVSYQTSKGNVVLFPDEIMPVDINLLQQEINEGYIMLSDGRYLPPKEAVQQCYNAFGIRVGLGDNWEDIYDGWNKEMK